MLSSFPMELRCRRQQKYFRDDIRNQSGEISCDGSESSSSCKRVRRNDSKISRFGWRLTIVDWLSSIETIAWSVAAPAEESFFENCPFFRCIALHYTWVFNEVQRIFGRVQRKCNEVQRIIGRVQRKCNEVQRIFGRVQRKCNVFRGDEFVTLVWTMPSNRHFLRMAVFWPKPADSLWSCVCVCACAMQSIKCFGPNR